jgi:type I restriction enzyme, S subunit
MTPYGEKPIKDFVLGIFDGPHATPKESDNGPIFLGIKNVRDGSLDLSDIRHVSEQDFPKWTKRVTPQPNDIVFSYEATLHRYAIIPKGFRGCLGRRIALIRPNPEKVENKYLLYYFLSYKWRKVVEGSVISGATVDRIPLIRFPDFPVSLPPLNIQQEIASILSTYDDLIENNLRRIALLEKSARLLYEEWFVRLRFPGHERVRIKDGVPDGWKKVPLSRLCSDVRISIDPNQVSEETPYIGLEHIPRRSITLSNWGCASEVTSNKFSFESGDILFGKIRPYFHKVGFALTDGITSSDAIVIRPKDEMSYLYCLLLLSTHSFVDLASKTVREGSKMPRADWKYLLKCRFLQPNIAVIEVFNSFAGKIVSQLKTLAIQNQKLKQARDLLLPKCIGQDKPHRI